MLFLVLFAVYEVVFLRWNAGQTPGKQHFGVRVVRAADGADPSVARAMARWMVPGLVLLAWPLWLGLALLALTAVTVPFGPGRRAVQDRLAGTRVVRYVHDEDVDDDPRRRRLDDEDGRAAAHDDVVPHRASDPASASWPSAPQGRTKVDRG